MSWARQLAEQIREQERLRLQEQERQAQRNQMFAAAAPPLWEQVVAAVERDVTDYNSVFLDEMKRMVDFAKEPPHRFRVIKEAFPAATLEAWFDLDQRIIEFRLSKKAVHGGPSSDKTHKIRLEMDDAGQVTLQFENRALAPDAASELILRPILAP